MTEMETPTGHADNILYSLHYVRDDALMSTSVRAAKPLYPRGPRSGPGYSVPVHQRLFGPIRPTRGHIPTSPPSEPGGLYQTPSLCIFAWTAPMSPSPSLDTMRWWRW